VVRIKLMQQYNFKKTSKKKLKKDNNSLGLW